VERGQKLIYQSKLKPYRVPIITNDIPTVSFVALDRAAAVDAADAPPAAVPLDPPVAETVGGADGTKVDEGEVPAAQAIEEVDRH
jgi:hypothetical protein